MKMASGSLRQAMIAGAAAAVLVWAVTPVSAQTIVEEWPNVKAPAPPVLKPVSVDAKSTALLLRDFGQQNCSVRPRCIASLPKVAKLAAGARAKNVLVVYCVLCPVSAVLPATIRFVRVPTRVVVS
jgi:hypothetical protein